MFTPRAWFRRKPEERPMWGFSIHAQLAVEFGEVWGNSLLAHSMAVRLSEREVTLLCDLLTSLGRHEAAEAWLSYHVEQSRDEPEEHPHAG